MQVRTPFIYVASQASELDAQDDPVFSAESEAADAEEVSLFERGTAIFRDEPTVSHDEVLEVLRKNPPLTSASDSDYFDMEPGYDSIVAYLRGRLRYPRLEALHRLLCGAGGPGDIQAIDNGPNLMPHLAIVLASLGSCALVKELRWAARAHHSMIVTDEAPLEISARIFYAMGGMAIYRPNSADIVYWTNPDPQVARDGENLGRDVAPGGYLVVQSDTEAFGRALFDPDKWQPVFDATLINYNGFSGIVIPTIMLSYTNFLAIYRRR